MGAQAKAATAISKSKTSGAPVATSSRRAIDLEPTTVFAVTMVAAAGLYFFRLGAASLGASEAYSAWAAAMPSPLAILHIPVPLDPGKQVFYYILLHYSTEIFGLNETSLRMLSAIFAVVTLAILFRLARSMFDDSIAASACVLWAFNPVIMILARRARMYPMFAAITLTHFMLLWQVRRRPTWPRTIACGLSGVLAIYTHLAGLFLIGSEIAMLLRDYFRSRRNPMAWIALAMTLVLFVPYFPILSTQSQALVYGHWLDWMGTSYHFNVIEKFLAAAIASAIALGVVFGRGSEDDPDEPLRWCFAWGLLPPVALLAGSIIVRPMFQVRYLIPCVAMIAVMIARGLDFFGGRTRNLAVAGITLVFVALAPVNEIVYEPWRDIAAKIAAQTSPDQPVFLESGFVFLGKPASTANSGFPEGYYRRPFDYYFHAANPRIVIPGWDPAAAKTILAERVAQAGGGWLVTWKSSSDVRAELPYTLSVREVVHDKLVTLYRIEPAASPN